MANLSLAFDIVGRDSGATRVLRNVGDAAEKAGKQGHQAGTLISSGMKLAAGALLGGGLIAGFKALYDAAAESQRIGRLTNAVLTSTGGVAGVTAKQVGGLADAISRKTGIDDEAIQSGENLLLTFTNIRNETGKGNNVFDQATSIINDMSVALGQDLKSSAIQVGKALNDPIKGVTALQRVGVSFTAQQKEQIATLVESGRALEAQKIILAELGKEFGGAAEAAATPMDKLRVTIGNLAEEAGGRLVPVVDGLANFFMDDLLPAVDSLSPVFDTFGSVLGTVADVGGKVFDFFNDLPGPIKIGAAVLGGMIALRGPLTGFFDNVATKAIVMKAALSDSFTSVAGFKSGIGGLVGAFGGPWGIALAGATVALGFLNDSMNESDDAAQNAQIAQQNFADAIRQSSGAITESVRIQAARALQEQGLLDLAEDADISTQRLTAGILGNRDAYAATVEALKAYRQSVLDKANEEKNADNPSYTAHLYDVASAVQQQIDEYGNLAQTLPAAVEGQQQVAAASGDATVAQQAFTAQLQDAADAASDARQETDLYKTALELLTGDHVSLLDAQFQLQEAVRRGTDALKENGGAVLDASGHLNRYSENGGVAFGVLKNVREAGDQLTATLRQQGATDAEVAKAEADLRNSFIATAGQMGIGQVEANKLADEILGIPSERNTTITADTGPARTQIEGLVNDYRGFAINLGIAGGSGTFAAAEGGILPGFTPGRDVHHFTSRTAGGLDLSGGEAVMRPEWTKAVGSSFVGRMNKIARTSGVAGVRSAMGFADGGVVPADWLGGMVFKTQIDPGSLSAARKALLEPGAGLVAGLRFAQSQVGKPYIWGGAGPGGYDCSGFMSAVTNVILGQSPYSRRGSTATFPWGGFVTGLGGGFSVGATRNAFGSGIGHMAGTLVGVNVESTGGVGVRVGGSALGSNSSLFGIRAHLAGYDSGGLLQPGYTLAYNGTGRAEQVIGPGTEMRLTSGWIEIRGDGMARIAGRVVREDRYRQGVNARSS